MFKYAFFLASCMEIELRRLDPADIGSRTTTFQYESDHHYRVSVSERDGGWTVDIAREALDRPFRKKEYEQIVTPYKGASEIYGAFLGGEQVGFIQVEFQEWNRSLRVWDIDVLPGHRRKGAGRAMMDLAKRRALEMGARRIVLETQTSNGKAMAFYRAMGFTLAGLDVSNYFNDDIARNEVRLEMAFYLE
jgi:ribosomal protein S18 acetylase RimI-like enzyme